MTGVPRASEGWEVSVAVFLSLHILLSLTILQKNCLQNMRKNPQKEIKFSFIHRFEFYFFTFSKKVSIPQIFSF